jgi:hypothetical protein
VRDQNSGLSNDFASPADGRRTMLANRDVVPQDEVAVAAVPDELGHLFADPPLVGNEKPNDFNRFFEAIGAAVRPLDAIAWLYTWDIACLSWEIRRERAVKAGIIKSAQIDFVSDLLKSGKLRSADGLSAVLARLGGTEAEARRWFNDPKSLPKITEKLTDNGYEASDILAGAYVLGADNIDAIDRRIASYESRRMVTVRQVEIYNEKLARKLDAASKDIVEAEFNDLPAEGA